MLSLRRSYILLTDQTLGPKKFTQCFVFYLQGQSQHCAFFMQGQSLHCAFYVRTVPTLCILNGGTVSSISPRTSPRLYSRLVREEHRFFRPIEQRSYEYYEYEYYEEEEMWTFGNGLHQAGISLANFVRRKFSESQEILRNIS